MLNKLAKMHQQTRMKDLFAWKEQIIYQKKYITVKCLKMAVHESTEEIYMQIAS